MTENLLLSLRYPKLDLDAIDKLLNGTVTEKANAEIQRCLENISDPINKLGYRPIKGRDKSKYRFIELAEKFSRDLKIDLDIVETDICIIADFYFDTFGCFTHLISAMIMADKIMVIPQTADGRAILSLVYNTHGKIPNATEVDMNM